MYQVKSYYTNAKKHNGYDSKFEAGYAQELMFRKKAKEIVDFEEQVNLDLIVNDYLVCQYRIDFIVYHHNDVVEYVECKGYATPVWRLKWKLFESLYGDKPDVKLTVVYQGKGKMPKPRKIKKINKI